MRKLIVMALAITACAAPAAHAGSPWHTCYAPNDGGFVKTRGPAATCDNANALVAEVWKLGWAAYEFGGGTGVRVEHLSAGGRRWNCYVATWHYSHGFDCLVTGSQVKVRVPTGTLTPPVHHVGCGPPPPSPIKALIPRVVGCALPSPTHYGD